MHCTQVMLVVVVMMVSLVHQSHGHYYRRSYFNRGLYRNVYAGSRYRGYYGGYRRLGDYFLRTILNNIYKHYKNKENDYDQNTVGDRGGPYTDNSPPVYIRLPSSVVRNPNFKMSDLPFYLASGLFDPNNFPVPVGNGGASLGGLPDMLPRPIVDPINPTGFGNANDGLNNNVNNQILPGSNTNPLGGTGSNLLGVPNTNILGGANTNLLGVPSGNVLGGSSGSLLSGGKTGLLAQGADPNTDFYNTKTGGIL